MKEISFDALLGELESRVNDGVIPPTVDALPRLKKVVAFLKNLERSRMRIQKVRDLATHGVTTGTTLAYFRYNRSFSYTVTVVTIDPVNGRMKVTVGDGSNHWVDPLKLELKPATTE